MAGARGDLSQRGRFPFDPRGGARPPMIRPLIGSENRERMHGEGQEEEEFEGEEGAHRPPSQPWQQPPNGGRGSGLIGAPNSQIRGPRPPFRGGFGVPSLLGSCPGDRRFHGDENEEELEEECEEGAGEEGMEEEYDEHGEQFNPGFRGGRGDNRFNFGPPRGGRGGPMPLMGSRFQFDGPPHGMPRFPQRFNGPAQMGFRGGPPQMGFHGRGFNHPSEMDNFNEEQNFFRGRGRGFDNDRGQRGGRGGHSLLNPDYLHADNEENSEYYNEDDAEEFPEEGEGGGDAQQRERHGGNDGRNKRERSEEKGDRRSDWKNRDERPQRALLDSPVADRDRRQTERDRSPERSRRVDDTRSQRNEDPGRTRHEDGADQKRSRLDPDDVNFQNPFDDDELTAPSKPDRSSEDCRQAAEKVREKLMAGGIAKEVVVSAREERRAGKKSRWGEGSDDTVDQSAGSVDSDSVAPNGAKNGVPSTGIETELVVATANAFEVNVVSGKDRANIATVVADPVDSAAAASETTSSGASGEVTAPC